MSFFILLVSFFFGAFSEAQIPFLPEPTRRYVLEVIGRALDEEDPVAGKGRYKHVIIFTSIMLVLTNLFCLYVLLLWTKYVFQKRGIYQRYLRWSAARDLRQQQEEYLFKQADEKYNKVD